MEIAENGSALVRNLNNYTPVQIPRHSRKLRLSPFLVWSLVLLTLLIALVRSLTNPVSGILPGLGFLAFVKFLEPVALFVGLGLVGIRAVQKRTSNVSIWTTYWLIGVGVVLGIGFLSALVWHTPLYYTWQSLYFFLRPALLFLLLRSLHWVVLDYLYLLKFIFVFGMANAVVTTYQQVVLWQSGQYFSADAMIGLFNDAHQQATVSYVIVFLLLASRDIFRRRWQRGVWMVLIGLNVFAAYIAQAQKTTGFFIVVLVGAVFWLVLRRKKWLSRAVVATPLAVLFLLVVMLAGWGGKLGERAFEATTGNFADLVARRYGGVDWLADVGLVQMFDDYSQRAIANPVVLIVGLGPSNYGSPASLTRVAKGDAEPWVRQFYFWESLESDAQRIIEGGGMRLAGLSAKTSVVGSSLGELGLLGFAAFAFLSLAPLGVTLPATWDPVQRTMLFWIKAAYLFILLQSALSNLGTWDNDVAITLIMAGLAAFSHMNQQEKIRG